MNFLPIWTNIIKYEITATHPDKPCTCSNKSEGKFRVNMSKDPIGSMEGVIKRYGQICLEVDLIPDVLSSGTAAEQMIDSFAVHTTKNTRAVGAKIQIVKKDRREQMTLKTQPNKVLHTGATGICQINFQSAQQSEN